MPDISFDNMKGLGNIGYDARQTLLTDARLKVNEESGAWKEGFEREFNVIKAFLKQMNASWANEIDNVTCDHIITPYVPEDESNDINIRMKANGGKPVESQLVSAPLFLSGRGTPMNRFSVYSAIRPIQEKLGVATGPHALRHTYISEIEKLSSPSVARDLANHKSIRITNRYDHSSSAQRREAVDKLHWSDVPKLG